VVDTSGRLVVLVQYTVSTSSGDRAGATAQGRWRQCLQHQGGIEMAQLLRKGGFKNTDSHVLGIIPSTPGQHAMAPGLEPPCPGTVDILQRLMTPSLD
jgi:hypothetical protein